MILGMTRVTSGNKTPPPKTGGWMLGLNPETDTWHHFRWMDGGLVRICRRSHNQSNGLLVTMFLDFFLFSEWSVMKLFLIRVIASFVLVGVSTTLIALIDLNRNTLEPAGVYFRDWCYISVGLLFLICVLCGGSSCKKTSSHNN